MDTNTASTLRDKSDYANWKNSVTLQDKTKRLSGLLFCYNCGKRDHTQKQYHFSKVKPKKTPETKDLAVLI